MSSYWSAIAKATGSWSLQEQTGLAASDAVAGRTASLLNGLDFATHKTAGPTSWLPSAIDLASSQHVIRVPYHADLNGGVYTVHGWAKWNGGNPTSYGAVWNCRSADPVRSGHLLYRSNSASWQHWYGYGGPIWRSYGAEPVSTDWEFLAVTYDGVASRIFVGGVQVSQFSASDYVANTVEPWTLGNIPALTTPFRGALAGFAIYDSALSAAEIAEIHGGPEPVAASPPAVVAEPTVGESLQFTPAAWTDPNNGPITIEHAALVSDDGVSGWTPVAFGLADGSAPLPNTLAAKHLRIESNASNSGGSGEPVSSPVYTIRRPPTPLRVAARAFSSSRRSAAAVVSDGAQAGLVTPMEAA